ncbi:MAG TPA: nucleotidyl transferase AbiEii/AbiGii toxin family protein, partial [Pseudodesulfovibrio sp.]|nr:nucleotidyl transferase AbiEii/AbiGii toxin family protein [Pseudodesulfovibrio sp.]
MDQVATWPRQERETLFLDSVERLPHLSPALIEKDFWVCWLLRRLFLLDQEVPMIFKGGTSISKAYPIIRRFSEDIDLSLDRERLGYGADILDAA